jgi:hypothetical protein
MGVAIDVPFVVIGCGLVRCGNVVVVWKMKCHKTGHVLWFWMY